MNKNSESGFTLLEVLGALAVAAIMTAGLMLLWQRSQENLQETRAAAQLQAVSEAVERYASANKAVLLASATKTTGPEVTVAQLAADGYLPSGHLNADGECRNIWNQTYGIHIRKLREDTLCYVLLTQGGNRADTPFLTRIVPAAALRARCPAGYVPTDINGLSDQTLVEAAGGYVLALANLGIASPGAGHLGVYAIPSDSGGSGASSDEVLYRKEVEGDDDHSRNTMQTTLYMADHSILNAGTITVENIGSSDDGVHAMQFDGSDVRITSCSSDDEGKLFLEASSGLYICRNGVKELISDSGNTPSSLQNVTIVPSGTLVSKPACTSGTPQIFVAPVMASSGAKSPSMAAWQAYAANSGTNWVVTLQVKNTSSDDWVTPENGYGQVMVLTVCQ